MNSDLYNFLIGLQNLGKIRTFVPQLYFDQSFAIDSGNPHSSFALYASAVGIHMDPALARQPDLSDLIAISAFGSVDRQVVPKFISSDEAVLWKSIKERLGWNQFCLAALDSFGYFTAAVGTTRRVDRLNSVIAFLGQRPDISVEEKEVLREVALRSFSREHPSVVDAEKRWRKDSRRLRSPLMAAKQWAYFQSGKVKLTRILADLILSIWRRFR